MRGLTLTMRDRRERWRRLAAEAPPVPPLNPATLFAGSEVGTWIRPNEATSVYQDPSGSLIGAVDQPVGFIEDLSKGRALGTTNLISNPGPFTVTTGWTGSRGTLSVVGGKLRLTHSGLTFPSAYTSFSTVIGQRYLVQAVSSFVSGTDNDAFLEKANHPTDPFGIVSGARGPGRSMRLSFLADATTSFLRMMTECQSLNDVYDWDAISVRTIAGIAAFQNVLGDRPTLRQGGNGVRFLENVSSDSLNWTAPAGTYTVAYVTPAGAVTILTGQSLSGAVNVMAASQVVEYLAVNRSLTAEETSGLTAYLQGVANP